MKITDWTADPDDEAPRVTRVNGGHPNGYTYSAERVIVGHCPECNAVLVVFNDNESWPLVGCACGWRGGTTEVAGYMRRTRADG